MTWPQLRTVANIPDKAIDYSDAPYPPDVICTKVPADLAIDGTTTAFVRAAAKEKALRFIAQEKRVTFSSLDSIALMAAINRPFAPNPAMEKAIRAAQRVTRSA